MPNNCFKPGDKVLLLENEIEEFAGKTGTIVEVKDDASGNFVFHKIDVAGTIVMCDDPNCLRLVKQ